MRKSHLVLVLAAATGPAHADSALSEYAKDVPLRDATEITELGCELDLTVTGGLVTGEVREKLKNTGTVGRAATLDLELPRGAVATGFGVGAETAVRVPAGASTQLVDPTQDVLDPDAGLLERAADGRYRVTLPPIASEHEVVLGVRFAVRPEVRDGALRLVIPAHDQAGAVHQACRAIVRATGGPGATVDKLRVDGTEFGARGMGAFVVDQLDVDLEIGLAFAGTDPVMWTQREELGEGKRAELTTVIAPPVKTVTAAKRVLFVVDTSRSMQMVGREKAAAVVRAIAAALPATTTYEGVLFDRAAARALGAWGPAAGVERAITGRAAENGTDIAAAFAVAKMALADGSGPTTIVVITDGLMPELAPRALVDALGGGGGAAKVDMHVVLLAPSAKHATSAKQLIAPVEALGGSYVELDADHLDAALAGASSWLRPAWVGLVVSDVPAGDVPAELLAGSGFSAIAVRASTAGARPQLVARMATIAHATAQPVAGATTGLAQLALATWEPHAFGDATTRERLERAHPIVTAVRGMAVLASKGKVAQSRRTMVAGGGPFTRMIALADPPASAAALAAAANVGAAAPTTSAIAEIALTRMFREELQPRAYVCYERALGKAPALAGTATFQIHIARGEVTRAVVTGLGDAAFDACLLDAAYSLAPAFPDFAINVDDETLARYPLSFKLADKKPTIVSGDADAPDRLDIDKIEGGVPGRRTPVKVDTKTPLGDMRPSPP